MIIMNEIEEFIKHHGVKGMRWGVRRYQPYPKGSGKRGKFLGKTKRTVGKIGEGFRKSRDTAKGRTQTWVDKTHKANYNEKKKIYDPYSRAYDKMASRGHKHDVSVRAAANYKIATNIAVTGLIVEAGKQAYSIAKSDTANAAKGSPLRYVDGSKMTNVIKTVR